MVVFAEVALVPSWSNFETAEPPNRDGLVPSRLLLIENVNPDQIHGNVDQHQHQVYSTRQSEAIAKRIGYNLPYKEQ